MQNKSEGELKSGKELDVDPRVGGLVLMLGQPK